MFYPIDVKALPSYKLHIEFSDGVQGKLDPSHLAGKGIFSFWNDYRNFEKVYISPNHAIAWSDEIDICPDVAYMEITGKAPHEIFPILKKELMHARKGFLCYHVAKRLMRYSQCKHKLSL